MALSSFNHFQKIIALKAIQQDPELSSRTAAKLHTVGGDTVARILRNIAPNSQKVTKWI